MRVHICTFDRGRAGSYGPARATNKFGALRLGRGRAFGKVPVFFHLVRGAELRRRRDGGSRPAHSPKLEGRIDRIGAYL